MPRVLWPLLRDRPSIRIVLTLAGGGRPVPHYLLADTGAGSTRAPVELLLAEQDCQACGARRRRPIVLTGAYAGPHNTYRIRVEIPELGFNQRLFVAGIPSGPPGFRGIACFRFLNRFTYGNFGDPCQFGLET